jgi:hypothetical protein
VPNARLAEAILSLVVRPERAASAVGDLVETFGESANWSFWTAVARLSVSSLWEQTLSSPFAMAASAVLGWFLYMAISLVLTFGGVVMGTLAWGILYFGAHHTGLELVVNALKLRLDWPPAPLELTYWVQPVVMWMAAPYQTGRLVTRSWPGRELAMSIVLILVWVVMASAAPLVIIPGDWTPPGRPGFRIATGTTASPMAMPLMLLFVFLAALRQRQASLRDRRTTSL